MSKNNTPFPHDRLFKSIMSNPKAIREFFEQNLPTNIRQIVNFDTISPQKETFIDNNLRLQLVDLLYSAEFNGKKGYLYLLVEHQATCDKLMPFRIIKYMVAIMDGHLKKTKKNILPIIYPLVIYSGWRNYNCSTDIFDLFGSNKELAKDILWHPFRLIDLSKIPDETLQNSIWYGVAAYLMKHIFEKDATIFFINIVELLKPIDKAGDIDYIYKIISYITEVTKIDREVFVETVKTGLTTSTGEKVMTLAEQFRQEGRQEGELRGIEKGKQEGLHKGLYEGEQKALKTVAMNLFGQGMTIKQVALVTGLSVSELNKLKAEKSN